MHLFISETDRKLLQLLEESLWRQETRFDTSYLDQILAQDFIEFGRSGRTYTRQQIIDQPGGPINPVLPLPNFNVRLLSPDIALVTYNSAATFDGILEKAHRTSIWSRNQKGWEIRFHQGTPYE